MMILEKENRGPDMLETCHAGSLPPMSVLQGESQDV